MPGVEWPEPTRLGEVVWLQPEPGAGIWIALALVRAAQAGVCVYIQQAREAGMSWHQVGEALGGAERASART